MTAKREYEFEINRYIHRIGEYCQSDIDNLLVDKLSKQALNVNQIWIDAIPKPHEITTNLGCQQ
jgi:hypothetical protein